jgi:hypothetical protein
VGQAAQRVTDLLKAAGRDAETAARRATAAANADEEAEDRRLQSTRQAAAVAEARRLYGAEYETLRTNRLRVAQALEDAVAHADRLQKEQITAAKKAAAAQSTLDGIAPQRGRAEQRRDECLRNLNTLVEERLASMPGDLPT